MHKLRSHSDFQVHDRRVSLFLDGFEEDGTPFDTQPLSARLSDIGEDGAMWVGLSSNGKDARFFPFFSPSCEKFHCLRDGNDPVARLHGTALKYLTIINLSKNVVIYLFRIADISAAGDSNSKGGHLFSYNPPLFFSSSMWVKMTS